MAVRMLGAHGEDKGGAVRATWAGPLGLIGGGGDDARGSSPTAGRPAPHLLLLFCPTCPFMKYYPRASGKGNYIVVN
jgi:hypothetical protein